MENNKSNTTQKKQKKSNPMKKIGASIKNTFIEMSNSLAGWIDDTGAQFTGQKINRQNQKNNSTTQQKATSNQSKSKTNA
ncbi:MAG: hypothetical protein NC133_00185 [Prevotella sp.]|nr:hypothetical protein [Prevotella sp.]